MQIIDNLIILALIIGAFRAGMKVSDHYNAKIKAQQEYCSKILAAKDGLGYIAPPQDPIGPEFMDHLLKHRRAVQALRKSR